MENDNVPFNLACLESCNEGSTVQKKGKGNQYPDRLKITPEALSRLALMCQQATNRLRGTKLTRSDLVNFLILNRAETLTVSELNELDAKYFDEVKFAQWALEELKASKYRGESVTLADIIAMKDTLKTDTQHPRKRRSTSSKPEEAPKGITDPIVIV